MNTSANVAASSSDVPAMAAARASAAARARASPRASPLANDVKAARVVDHQNTTSAIVRCLFPKGGQGKGDGKLTEAEWTTCNKKIIEDGTGSGKPISADALHNIATVFKSADKNNDGILEDSHEHHKGEIL